MNMAAVTEQTTEAFDWKLSLVANPWYVDKVCI